MLALEPVLSFFQFCDLCSTLDTYNLFKVETKHCLSLGLSETLKECIIIVLKDESTVIDPVVHTSRKLIPFNIGKRRVLKELNSLIHEVENDSSEYGLGINL